MIKQVSDSFGAYPIPINPHHMIKFALLSSLLVSIFFLKSHAVFVQDTKTYLIQLAHYKVILTDQQLALRLTKFKHLKHLGFLYETSYLHANRVEYSRIILGSYVGKHTAARILQQVKASGIANAKIIEAPPARQAHALKQYRVYQIIALNQLNLTKPAYECLNQQLGNGAVKIAFDPKTQKYKIYIHTFKKSPLPTSIQKRLKRCGFRGFMAKDIRKTY